ncbi:MAG: hypothetical protein IPP49_15910 [Saprospiraceae bacterium]|nr:hypothetical protein [Saprospiraceae bacterium]
MVILIPWFLPLLSDAMHFLFGTQDIYTNNTDMTIGLSAFHTAFNLLHSLLLMYFPKWLIGLASLGLKKMEMNPAVPRKILKSKYSTTPVTCLK